MQPYWSIRRRIIGLAVLPLVVSCQATDPLPPPNAVSHTVPSSLRVPGSVQRLAVLYEDSGNGQEREAYQRLAGAAFQIKELRPSLSIIERSHLSAIIGEQQFQLAGSVSEDTAVRVGRLMGVDSVLIYHIQGPSLRDRMFAESHSDLPPFLVTSKIIRVQSAEVLFHNVVTAPIENESGPPVGGFSSQAGIRALLRAALDRGVSRTISDLRRAFR